MIHSSIVGGIVDGTSPPADTGAVSPPVCTDCGGCNFSDLSSLEVKVHTITRRPDCSLMDTYVTETWAYVLHDSDHWVWRKDSDNIATFLCATKTWSYTTTPAPLDTSAGAPACVGIREGAGFQVNSCAGASFWAQYNGKFFLVFEIAVVDNDCLNSEDTH